MISLVKKLSKRLASGARNLQIYCKNTFSLDELQAKWDWDLISFVGTAS
jgi:hypothetical protein